jgi:hypothetical protein
MGAAGSIIETISAQMPLEAIQSVSESGGNVQVMWKDKDGVVMKKEDKGHHIIVTDDIITGDDEAKNANDTKQDSSKKRLLKSDKVTTDTSEKKACTKEAGWLASRGDNYC